MNRAAVYSMPECPPIRLDLAPRLESWEAREHRDQVHLREWVAHVQERIHSELAAIHGPAALRLDVGLPEDADPLWQRDLDNYLYPIARELSDQVVSFWATKGRAQNSTVRVAPAQEGSEPAWTRFQVGPALGSESAWKRAVHDAVKGATELPEGPVGLQIAVACGPGRRWPAMWKRTIDGLDPILGRSVAGKHWDPLDGRIVRLGLHRHVDPTLGHHARATIWATLADPAWPELGWLRSMTHEARESYFVEHRRRRSRSASRAEPRPRPAASGREVAPHQGPGETGPGVLEFRGDDDAYLAWLASQQRGWVVNARRNPNAAYLQLHRASCPSICEPRRHGAYTEREYIKFCAVRREDLDAYFERVFGTKPRWSCTRCG